MSCRHSYLTSFSKTLRPGLLQGPVCGAMEPHLHIMTVAFVVDVEADFRMFEAAAVLTVDTRTDLGLQLVGTRRS